MDGKLPDQGFPPSTLLGTNHHHGAFRPAGYIKGRASHPDLSAPALSLRAHHYQGDILFFGQSQDLLSGMALQDMKMLLNFHLSLGVEVLSYLPEAFTQHLTPVVGQDSYALFLVAVP